ncbi:Epidermal retinol dehydrogenase 2 [Bienertia sinuspersici]
MSQNRMVENKQWSAPNIGLYKMNTNAAMFDGKLVASCEVINGRVEVDVAEAVAARHGLHIAIEAGLNKLVLKTDCMKLSFGKVGLVRILYLVGRNGNKVTHELARSRVKY